MSDVVRYGSSLMWPDSTPIDNGQDPSDINRVGHPRLDMVHDTVYHDSMMQCDTELI